MKLYDEILKSRFVCEQLCERNDVTAFCRLFVTFCKFACFNFGTRMEFRSSCHEQTEFPSTINVMNEQVNAHAVKLTDIMLFAILNSIERTRNWVRKPVKGTHYIISSSIISHALPFSLFLSLSLTWCEWKYHCEFRGCTDKNIEIKFMESFAMFKLRYTFINQLFLMPFFLFGPISFYQFLVFFPFCL